MFLLQKYIQPAWYYGLAHRMPNAVLVDPALLTAQDLALLDKPSHYKTALAQRMDLAYQALQKGFIPASGNPRSELQDTVVTHLEDNYRFIQRYFGKLKSIYVCIIRLLSFHNPFAELSALLTTWNQPKINLHSENQKHSSFYEFDSALMQEKPLITIVIPTLNRYTYLKDVLHDLEQQTYKHFEVLVCDQSEPIDKSFYKGWKLNIRVIEQSERALWRARNTCINNSNGSFIALSEDDVRVESNWLALHLKCIDYFSADASCGLFHPQGSKIHDEIKTFKLSEIFATGNTLIKKSVFNVTGLFDRQFEGQRMGDGEFGTRCLLNGFRLISNPEAYCIDVKAPSGGLRTMGSWDSLRPTNFFAPRPVPSVLYYIRKYFGNNEAILYLIKNIPSSIVPYRYRKSKILKIISVMLFLIISPLILYSVVRSWKLSNSKLREGSKIKMIKTPKCVN